MKILLTAALFASVLSAPAFAADTAKSDAPPPKDAAADKRAEQKVVCTKEHAVGSIIERKVCRTVAEVKEDERNVRRVQEERQSQGSARALPGATSF